MTTMIPRYAETPPNRRALSAQRIHEDFLALVAAGFSRAEALRMIIALLRNEQG